MELVEQVNNIMFDAIDEGETASGGGFYITDDGLAEWAMGKIRDAQREKERMSAHFKKQADEVSKRTEEQVGYFSSLLAAYFERVPRNTTKTGIEKYKLPSGELIKKPGGIDYERDDKALLVWCKESHPEFVKTEEKPSWADVKKLIKDTGELPQGVIPVETPARFEVKIDGE